MSVNFNCGLRWLIVFHNRSKQRLLHQKSRNNDCCRLQGCLLLQSFESKQNLAWSKVFKLDIDQSIQKWPLLSYNNRRKLDRLLLPSRIINHSFSCEKRTSGDRRELRGKNSIFWQKTKSLCPLRHMRMAKSNLRLSFEYLQRKHSFERDLRRPRPVL